MVEGESGLLAIGPPQQRPQYEPTKRRLTWPNGAIATTYSADEPERLRGPQHDAAWCDEIASWRYPEAWDMLMFGLRLGPDPRVVVTTTPKPIKIIRELLTDPTTVVTRGSTYDNRANLAPTRSSRRSSGNTKERGLAGKSSKPNYSTMSLAHCGIARASKSCAGRSTKACPISSVSSSQSTRPRPRARTRTKPGSSSPARTVRGAVMCSPTVPVIITPTEWAQLAIALYRQHKADRIVAEVNNGGDMVEATLRMIDPNVALYRRARLARESRQSRTRRRALRAEPGRVSCRRVPDARRSDVRVHHGLRSEDCAGFRPIASTRWFGP